MARILICTTPSPGHMNPFRVAVKKLVERGHNAHWYTSAVYREQVREIGVTLHPIEKAVDLAGRRKEEVYPQLKGLTGLKDFIGSWKYLFMDNALPTLDDLLTLHKTIQADVILSDETSFGAGFFHEKTRVPWVMVSSSIYFYRSRDTAPLGLGMLPNNTPIGRLRNRALALMTDQVILRSLRLYATTTRQKAGLKPLAGGVLQNVTVKPTRYMLCTIPSFEYPRSDMVPNTYFVGALLDEPSTDYTPPAWWHSLNSHWPVIHVTQGTVSNDAHRLLVPAIKGLADQDMHVVVTTGGPDAKAIGIEALPSNVNVEAFVPYRVLMERASVMLTNGGFGGVQSALSSGIPVIVAGATEEKPDVAAHVEWAGVGINLRTQQPTPDALRTAVEQVLTTPRYKERAQALQREYRQYNAPELIADHVDTLLKGLVSTR
ncbi:MAG: glycosyltransferase [Anaerolineae bacterium]